MLMLNEILLMGIKRKCSGETSPPVSPVTVSSSERC